MKHLRIGVGLSAVPLLLLQGCDGCNPPPLRNVISSVEIVPVQNKPLGVPLAFVVKGWGACDASPSTGATAPRRTSWLPSGPAARSIPTPLNRSRISAARSAYLYGVGGRQDRHRDGATRLRGPREDEVLDQPGGLRSRSRPARTQQMRPCPGKPPVQNRSVVRITTVPPNLRCPGIYYQHVTPHCYDADGIATPATTPGFPTSLRFPGMRPFSLVLRVGTQVVQGGTSMSFVANQTAPLEICVNEHDSTAGSGGYEVHIRTDENGPPEPFEARLTLGAAPARLPANVRQRRHGGLRDGRSAPAANPCGASDSPTGSRPSVRAISDAVRLEYCRRSFLDDHHPQNLQLRRNAERVWLLLRVQRHSTAGSDDSDLRDPGGRRDIQGGVLAQDEHDHPPARFFCRADGLAEPE